MSFFYFILIIENKILRYSQSDPTIQSTKLSHQSYLGYESILIEKQPNDNDVGESHASGSKLLFTVPTCIIKQTKDQNISGKE